MATSTCIIRRRFLAGGLGHRLASSSPSVEHHWPQFLRTSVLIEATGRPVRSSPPCCVGKFPKPKRLTGESSLIDAVIEEQQMRADINQVSAQLASALRKQALKAKEVDQTISQIVRLIGVAIEEQQLRAEINLASAQLASALHRQIPKAKEFDQTTRQINRLIDAAMEEQRLRADIDGNYGDAVLALGRRWNGHNTDWNNLAPSVYWWLDHARQVSPEVVDVLQRRSEADNTLPLADAIGETVQRSECLLSLGSKNWSRCWIWTTRRDSATLNGLTYPALYRTTGKY